MSARPEERGFSLLEILVALAIFSLAVLALINLSGENTRAASAIEARVLGGVVADNRAVEAMTSLVAPPIGTAQGQDMAGDRPWRWTRRVSATPDPAIVRIDIIVADPRSARTVAELTLFRGRT